MTGPIRQAIWSIDPDQAITSVFTFDDAVDVALARPRMWTVLLGAFGGMGLLLGAIGLYGMLAALVSERRREIGVRLALGARPEQVRRMIVRNGVGLALIGVACGLVAALRAEPAPGGGAVRVQARRSVDVRGDAALLVVTAVLAAGFPPVVRPSSIRSRRCAASDDQSAFVITMRWQGRCGRGSVKGSIPVST